MTHIPIATWIGLAWAMVFAGCGKTDANGSAFGGGNGSASGGNVATETGGSENGGGEARPGGADSGSGGATSTAAGSNGKMSFFVTSDTSKTGDLGGLDGADARCQGLATAVGYGSGRWRAYLSAELDPANGTQPVNARDRIGNGPWYNQRGAIVASNLDELHGLKGNPELFIDEQGARINGQWIGSPTPNEHDILTGSTATGTVMTGFTCESWTSNSSDIAAQVGHSDGLGPSVNPNPPYDSWNSSHANASRADTAPRGGAGRLYCFLVN